MNKSKQVKPAKKTKKSVEQLKINFEITGPVKIDLKEAKVIDIGVLKQRKISRIISCTLSSVKAF
jgi:hypothetical protein